MPGLGTLSLGVWGVALGFLGVAIWLSYVTWRQTRLEHRLKTLFTASSGADLEAMLQSYLAQVQETASQVRDLNALAKRLQVAARYSLQHMGVVRFNPFPDTGGNQSFAIALVDGHGNGVVISSLHAREGTRVYAKPLKNWESDYALTEEEKQAIAIAYQQQSA